MFRAVVLSSTVLVAIAQDSYITFTNANSGEIRVDGPTQLGRITVKWGNIGDDVVESVSMVCAVDDDYAYFTDEGRTDFLTMWTFTDENDLGAQRIKCEPYPLDTEVPVGQFRTAEHIIRFDPETPNYHETCVTCRLLTTETGSVDVLGEVSTTLKMFNSPAEEDSALDGACPKFETVSVRDDPHVYTADGRVVDIYLKPNEWHPMLAGPSYSLSGRVFSLATDETAQWFNGFALVDSATGVTLFNATLRGDVADGEIRYFDAALDGQPLNKTNAMYTSRDGLISVRASKLRSSARRGALNDLLSVTTPDFSLTIESSRETNQLFFKTQEEQDALTHLDIKFVSVPHPQDLGGPLAELMFGNVLTSKSAEAKAWTTKMNAIAA
eukprot:CAMPEP_0197426604 /NCGR_PEP_ID=MMETSP1170-20131217/35510_1 /TAXON_ID=54406 /ORGANISM="Sarcinochrysis sp, Strain CCMP770" /LENGTH=382 /DNA_ID=CAMNT_0042954249 /DNA_START=70 /DNA_END=1218 /DNA_ORIENTATION=+